ncbi:uncharacterized protein ARMOST_12676 [Armillaria ostoyae]|uniref:Uncharacterized protein n=1 Tax=Armillaria ostoyae TaxID=47428 RepID=A0A284RKM0_ARMOS|nr:uncharacterized protein ARMOST_12676 [Armillaria ostoyae]
MAFRIVSLEIIFKKILSVVSKILDMLMPVKPMIKFESFLTGGI